MSSLDYARARAFVASVPRGRWTALKDVAEVAGNRLAFMAIGNWLRANGPSIPNYWRVINADGRVPPGFVAHAPGLPHDAVSARERLTSEGVQFSASGRASRAQQFTVRDWKQAAPGSGLAAASPPARLPAPTGIQLGATVRALAVESGAQRTWGLVGPAEVDPAVGRVSVESPVGRALLGRAIGDVVTVSAPKWDRRYRILDADPYTPPQPAKSPAHKRSTAGGPRSINRLPNESLEADLSLEALSRAASQSPDWLPVRIAHADWGTAASKCVVATAELDDGVYHVRAPRPVREGPGLIERMRLADRRGQSTLLGFDFPLGVPRAYARCAGISNFASWFRELDLGSPFFDVASEIEEVSVARPFFPKLITTKSPGIQAQFHQALGLTAAQMFRRCDRAHCGMGGASPMFWALGPKAVGKMTLAGWRQTIRPALAEAGRRYALWPFDGPMRELLVAADAVIIETYPRDAYFQLGLGMGSAGTAKTRQSDRAADAPRLLQWCVANAVRPDNELVAQMLDGFGSSKSGEDPFDAVVGLFAMINTVRRAPEPELPEDPQVRLIEGWMFGQHSVCPV